MQELVIIIIKWIPSAIAKIILYTILYNKKSK